MVFRRTKPGDPIEFTRDYRQHYTLGEGEYGIAVEPERSDGSVTVELEDGSLYLARHIHARSWIGWIPEGLEPIQEKHMTCPEDDY